VELVIKAWGEHSVSELDDLIDIVRRKIEDEEKRQSKIRLDLYQDLRG
jgi:hypothetical protein